MDRETLENQRLKLIQEFQYQLGVIDGKLAALRELEEKPTNTKVKANGTKETAK